MTDLMLNEQVLGQLRAPQRNRYFYGKLLDVRQLELEQTYGVTQRRLMNRLGLGSGVLCGLQLELGERGLLVRPGVAVDGFGREITVPASYCLEDPAQPTDDDGRPVGDKVVDGVVTIYLCYTECAADPAPVLVGDCDSRNGFAPGTTVERFKLIVRKGLPDRLPGLSDEQCAALFPVPLPAQFDLRRVACRLLDVDCAPPDESCVALGVVRIDPDGKPAAVEVCEPRNTIYSNSRLFDLLACLADLFASCCAVTELRYVSGDAQQGKPGDRLPDPLQVRVVDHLNHPVGETEVTFHVQAGNGRVSDGTTVADRVVVVSGPDGQAGAMLEVGPDPGPVSVEATLADGARVVFSAWVTGERPPPARPPVVLGLQPRPAEAIVVDDGDAGTAWAKEPMLRVTFDREMDSGNLRAPDDWLRLWIVTPPGEAKTTLIQRFALGLADVGASADGFTATYKLDAPIIDLSPAAALVQMRARGTSIVSADPTPVLLDAEFAGSQIPDELLEKIWEMVEQRIPREVWDAMVETGATLPRSGDGVPGGLFHAWFEFVRGLG